MSITGVKPSPKDLFEMNRDGELAIRAIKAGMSLSAFLEKEDPTRDLPLAEQSTDAFTRQMQIAGIVTRSNPAQGIWADTLDAFDDAGARGLLIEFFNRRWREARFLAPANPFARSEAQALVQMGNRSFYSSADDALGSIFRPYSEAGSPRSSRLSAAIPLQTIVALTTPIDSDSYRAAYMTEPAAADVRKVRVGELGEIPLAHITMGEHEVKLHKYARGFEISYEALRRQRIDKISFWVQRAAVIAENDKFEQGLSVLINGDGNGNAATVYESPDLDASLTDGGISARSLVAFKGRFQNDYVCDTIITTEDLKIDLEMLDFGTGNIPFAALAPQFGGFTELNHRLTGGVRLGRSDQAVASGIIVGIDTSTALEHVMEVGSSISETQKFVTRQSDVVVMSEVEGFAVLDQKATRVWDTNDPEP